MISAKAAQGVGLASFSVVGDELWAVLTDHTILGPYKLPVATVRFVGTWAPSTAYLTNQIFTMNGSTYIVLMNHTSAATFDPGANDGHGNDYYGLLLSDPANALPTGGAVGMVLEKATTADFAAMWTWPTLASLHDVLQSPPPSAGDLVAWTGAAFSYVDPATVRGPTPAFTELSDVAPSPAPANGDLVTYSASMGAFTYIDPASIVVTAPPGSFQTLTDVLPSPAPTYNQLVYWNGSAFTYKTPTTVMLTDWQIGGLQPWDQMYWDSVNGWWRNRQPPPIYDGGWGGAFTLGLYHANELVDISSGSTITVPPHASIPFAIGATIWFRQTGAMTSAFALAAGTGVTLNKPAGRLAQPRALGSIVMLQQTGVTDTWEVSGDLAYDGAYALPTSGTWNMDARLVDLETFKWTPAGNNTINLVAGGAPMARELTLIITTSGTTSYTITFGSNFRSTGTLATGTVTGKVFVIRFIGDGANFNEISRTAAM